MKHFRISNYRLQERGRW